MEHQPLVLAAPSRDAPSITKRAGTLAAGVTRASEVS